MAPATTSSNDASPASWPFVRGRPRAFAQRPLPSITIAMCLGISSTGRTGGRAPDGCGNGAMLLLGSPPALGPFLALLRRPSALSLVTPAPPAAGSARRARDATAGRRSPGHCPHDDAETGSCRQRPSHRRAEPPAAPGWPAPEPLSLASG